MIKQNLVITQRLAERTKGYNLLQFILSLTVEEWKEYLLFLFHADHDPRDEKPNFSYESNIKFPYELNQSRGADLGSFHATVSAFENYLRPKQKAKIEEAINSLLDEHLVEEDFLRIALKCIGSYSGGKFALFNFQYELLLKIIIANTEVIKTEQKSMAISAIGQLPGTHLPSKETVKSVLIEIRKRYMHTDTLLHPVIYVFFRLGFEWEGVETLIYLQKEWPKVYQFEKKLAQALTNCLQFEGKYAEKIKKEIIPNLKGEIKEKFVRLLKKGITDSKELYFKKDVMEVKIGVGEKDLIELKSI